MERRYSKDQFEMYLNSVYFGEEVWSWAASEIYFNKSAKDVDLAQLLC